MKQIRVVISSWYNSNNLYAWWHPQEQVNKLRANIKKVLSKTTIELNSFHLLQELIILVEKNYKDSIELVFICQEDYKPYQTTREQALENLFKVY